VLRGRDLQEFMEMKREGLSVQAISKLTGYDRKTVRKYLLGPEAVPRYGPREKQLSKLDAHKPYLHDRLKAGVWNAQVLLRELRQRGYQGGCTILKDWLQPQRAAGMATAVRRFEMHPWSVAFPPCPPPAVAHLCSNISKVLRNRPTPRRRACWTPGSWPSPTGPPHFRRRASTGSPGSRAWSFHACPGSLTAQSPLDACDGASCGVAFRHVSRRRHSDRDYFAAQYPACMCPCQRFNGNLAVGHA